MELKIKSQLSQTNIVQNEDVIFLFWQDGNLFTAINTSDNRGIIKVWTVNLELVYEVQAHEYPIYHMTPGQGSEFYTSCSDASIRHWEYQDGKVNLIDTLRGHQEPPSRLRFAGNRLYSADSLGEVRMWEKGEMVGCLGTVEDIWDMLVKDNVIYHTRLQDVYLTNFRSHDDKVGITWSIKNTINGRGPLLITPDGAKMCLQSRSTYEVVIHELDTAHNPLLATLKGHEAIISSYVCDQDSKILYSGGFDGKVIAWDLTAYKPLAEVKLQGPVNDMAYDPVNNIVIAAGENGFMSALKLQ